MQGSVSVSGCGCGRALAGQGVAGCGVEVGQAPPVVVVPRPARVDRRAVRRLRANDIRLGSTSWSASAIDSSTRRASWVHGRL